MPHGRELVLTRGKKLPLPTVTDYSSVHLYIVASASLTKRIDEPVKLADEAEGPSPLWNGSTCKRQCYGKDQAGHRLPTDASRSCRLRCQIHTSRRGQGGRDTRGDWNLLSERASQEQTRRSPSRGCSCKKAACRSCLRPVSFTRAASLSRSRLQTERKNREGSHAAMPHRQIIWWLPQEKDTWGGRQLTMAGDAQTLQASL